MEVGFDLGSGRRSSPTINYSSAPLSPRQSGLCFFSAPNSPSRPSDSPLSAIPFHWEETPGTPKSPGKNLDFAFDVSLDTHKNSTSAEELFDGGKIRPLKRPPGLQKQKTEVDRRGGRIRGRSVKQSSSFSSSTKGSSKKWSFKNLLLFRSASPWDKEYTPVSNKQESQDLKRKTSLACKQGVLGRLPFGSMLHALGNGSASFGR